MGFSDEIRAFATQTQIRMDMIVKKVTFDMTKSLVLMTPVDTGRARSNYFFGYDPVSSIDATEDKKGTPSFERCGQFLIALKAGGVFYITNNVEYILALEYGGMGRGGPKVKGAKTTADGHSTQAPAGMARVTVARWQSIVKQAAAAVR